MAQSSQDSGIEADHAEVLSSMDDRLHSFQHFPRSQSVSVKRLAMAGFYYTGQADKVQCYSCNAALDNWNEGDVPLKRHQQASPFCMFLNCARGMRPINNSSILNSGSDYDEEAEAMELQLRTGEVMDETVYPKVPHMKSEEARLRTFSNWPVNSPVQPSDLAEAGMFSLGREDSVQCFCCGGMLAQWDQGDDPWNEHEKYYPNCFFILGHDVGNVPLKAPRRVVNGREAPLETFEGRLDTFIDRQHPIDHERLARAGFYSTGDRDKVICFKCGGGVKDWLPEEDPWEEHARHYPGCSFLLAEKGSEYVSEVQLRYPRGQHSRPNQNGLSSHEEEKDPMTKLEQLQREKLCKVCMDQDISIVFIPCAHLVTCEKCSESLNKCPICCATIAQKIKTYIA